MKKACLLFLMFFIFYANVWARNSSSVWYTQTSDKRVIINIELYLSTTCPHCQSANAFFTEIQGKYPQFKIQRFFINQDKNALMRFNELLSAQQLNDFAVPSIYFCNSRWLGFDSVKTSGRDLLKAINYCQQQIEKKENLTQATVDTLRQWSDANRIESRLMGKTTPSNEFMKLALIDTLNPCAYFCIAGFLSVLSLGQQRKKQMMAGFLFCFATILAHYFQQIATYNFFLLLSWLQIPALFLGLSTLYFVVQYHKNKTYSSFYLILAFFLGFMLTLYQQTCSRNWPSIFADWLNKQTLSSWESFGYQVLYQSIYIAPLVLILFVYLLFLNMKRFAAFNLKLIYISKFLLIAIALCLIIYPYVLSHLLFSTFIILLMSVLGYLGAKTQI